MKYSIVIEATSDPEYYGVYCPDFDSVGACTASGRTIDEAICNGREAIREMLIALRAMGVSPPAPNPNAYVRVVDEGCDSEDSGMRQ